MNSQVKKLTFTALMAAMITIFTAYICHIPVGQNGGYIHFGDSLIYIAACLLPWPYAMTTGYAITEAFITYGFTKQAFTGLIAIIPVSVPGSCIQSGGSAIIFVILGLVLDKIGFKRRLFTLEETK